MAETITIPTMDDFSNLQKRVIELEKLVKNGKNQQFGEYLRPKDASKYLGVSISTLNKYAREGKLSPIRRDKTTHFKKSDLEKFINN
jgi:excisionase family DNA binding protein